MTDPATIEWHRAELRRALAWMPRDREERLLRHALLSALVGSVRYFAMTEPTYDLATRSDP